MALLEHLGSLTRDGALLLLMVVRLLMSLSSFIIVKRGKLKLIEK